MPEPSPNQPRRDPVVSSSLSQLLLVFALLMVVVLLWSLYDEHYGQRPWKHYQERFVKSYTALLEKQIPLQAERERQVRQSPDFQKLEQDLAAAEKQVASEIAEIDREVHGMLTPKIAILNKTFAEARGTIDSLTYEMETASSSGSKEALLKKIAAAREKSLDAELPESDGSVKKTTFRNFQELEEELTSLKTRSDALESKRAALLKPADDLRKKRDAYLKDHLDGLSESQLQSLLRKMQSFPIDIRQIYVPGVELADRCESCHLGIREPVAITKADVGGEGAFTSHPNPELLQIHDPERFGCTPCHNGNGRATTSIEKAHGQNEHWLWPLYRRENIEAGCQQCHARDRFLPNAPVLSRGKELYDHRGCAGCHRFEGYDPEADELQSTAQAIVQKEAERHQVELDIAKAIAEGDRARNSNTVRQFYAKADGLRVSIGTIDNRLEQLNRQAKNLMRETKKTGPSLKEVRLKLNKNWIPTWLENPQTFRPDTRMPKFRLEADERNAIAAFIWQAGVPGTLPSQPKGDPVRGKELFAARGCMACHSVGEGKDSVGGTFAANLSRVGEKANYDYLVRWVRNPRERPRPYCPLEKRDLGPEDYARAGLPYVFDLDHSTCPNDGRELQVQQMTVMPNLRLTLEESRDIATYLTTLKKKEPGDYPPAPFVDDPSLREKGLALVKRFGCAGCHEIAGLEEESLIGTELTKEGSKPVENLDFALLGRKAREEGWHSSQGFIQRKVENPSLFDQGKVVAAKDRLRMPEFNLLPADVSALTTFLLGSIQSPLPAEYFHQPQDQGRDIQEGWRIVAKYNCVGCHVLRVGQRSVLMDLPRFQDPDGKLQLPPRLTGEGARVDPNWLARFLANPALSDTDANRNGVRPYLQARMPTFFFSDGEVGKLVRFFEALSTEQEPYIPPKLEPLTEEERTLARQLFSSKEAPCLKCHATGDAARDQRASAPSYLLSRARLQPGWTRRWMLDPSMMDPGTAMPTGLFKPEGNRMVFAGPTPAGFERYKKDHAELLVRYMLEFTPEEQRRLALPPVR